MTQLVLMLTLVSQCSFYRGWDKTLSSQVLAIIYAIVILLYGYSVCVLSVFWFHFPSLLSCLSELCSLNSQEVFSSCCRVFHEKCATYTQCLPRFSVLVVGRAQKVSQELEKHWDRVEYVKNKAMRNAEYEVLSFAFAFCKPIALFCVL